MFLVSYSELGLTSEYLWCFWSLTQSWVLPQSTCGVSGLLLRVGSYLRVPMLFLVLVPDESHLGIPLQSGLALFLIFYRPFVILSIYITNGR